MKPPPDDLIKQGTPKRPEPFRLFGGSLGDVEVGEVIKHQTHLKIPEADRRCHSHVIGSTGGGKSKLLEYLIRQDLLNPNAGLCLIDPHGSLYDDLVHYISHKYPRLAKRVVLFNPAGDLDQILGFNPIPTDVDDVAPVANQLTSYVLKALGQDAQTHTPRISRWLKNIFYPLVANQLTLLEATPFFSIYDAARRQDILKTVRNETLLADWTEFDKLPPKDRIQTIEGAANRLIHFLENRRIRHMIGQSGHTLDLGQVMDEGKILLVNLNGGVNIPHESTHLLGVMLVNELFRTAMLRNSDDQNNMVFCVYIDEFGQYVTRDIARGLEEARKKNVFLTLAHQHLSQLKTEDEYLYTSVLTNCKNKYVFGGLSKADAEIMSDDISTGFVNLKSVKDEVYTTKVRHVEETRTVLSKSTSDSSSSGTGGGEGLSHSDGANYGQTASQSFGTNQTSSQGQATAHMEGTGRTSTSTTSDTKTNTVGSAEGQSNTSAETYAEGRSENRTISDGQSEMDGWSTTDTTNHNRVIGRNQGVNTAKSKSRPVSGDGGAETLSSGQSSSKVESLSRGGSHAETRSGSTTKTHTVSNGQGTHESHGCSEAVTSNSSTHESTSKAHQVGKSEAESSSQSDTVTNSETQAEGQSYTLQNGVSFGRSVNDSIHNSTSWSNTDSHAETHGQAEVPFLRPEEYQELTSRTFWTKDELHYMHMAKIKNQGTGVAFVKIGENAPVQVEIDYVATPYKSPVTSSKKIERFTQAVFDAHQEFYTPKLFVHEEYEQRQRSLFSDGEPIAFDEGPLKTEAHLIEAVVDEGVEDPFIE